MLAIENSATPNPSPDLVFLGMIEQLVGAMNQVGNCKKILGRILPCALSVTGLESGALLVAGDGPDELNLVARRDLPDEIIEQLTQGSLADLLLLGQQLWVKPRPLQLNPEQALLGRHKFKYLLGLPCRFEGRVLGAIVVGSRRISPELFNSKLQNHLATLAQLLAVFLDDVRLRAIAPAGEAEKLRPVEAGSPAAVMETGELEQLLAAIMNAEEEVVSQNRDLELLNELASQIIGTVQLNQVLETAVAQTCAALQVRASWCYLHEEGMLRLRKYQGLSNQYVQEMQCLDAGNGVEGMAFSRNEIIARDSSLFHIGVARQQVRQEGLGLVAAVPLHLKGQTVGVLAVSYGDGSPWASRDKRMLLQIGRQVEQAMAGALQYNEAQQMASSWENNYQGLLQSNKQLVGRIHTLELQVELLRQLERQIWAALSASPSNPGRRPAGPQRNRAGSTTDEALAVTLKTILTTVNKKFDPELPPDGV
jgi:GAF domain-containing protein